MTTLDLAAIEADLQRQLDRTRRMPMESLIIIHAETLRGLIAVARAGNEPRARPPVAETAAPLRTAILDALMERWRERMVQDWTTVERDYASSCLDMILPVAEPMIREATLREARETLQILAGGRAVSDDPGADLGKAWHEHVEAMQGLARHALSALGEPK